MTWKVNTNIFTMVISVALCTYNGEKYIRQQLDSILSQTMPVDEIVIHDMGITLFSHQQLWPYIENDLLQKFLFEVLCLKGNFVTGATLVITKAAKELVLPYRTALIMAHDGWIALKLSSMGKLGYINKTLMSYRIHPKQQAGLDLSDRNDVYDDIALKYARNVKNLMSKYTKGEKHVFC